MIGETWNEKIEKKKIGFLLMRIKGIIYNELGIQLESTGTYLHNYPDTKKIEHVELINIRIRSNDFYQYTKRYYNDKPNCTKNKVI